MDRDEMGDSDEQPGKVYSDTSSSFNNSAA